MIKKIFWTNLLVSFFILNANAQVKLQDGTQVDIITTEAISSKTAKERDPLIFHMAEDVVVNGKIVIKAGAIVKGEIVEVEKSKMLGKAGKLDFSLDYAKAVDGQNVRLRATKSFEGKDKQTGTIVAAYLFLPLVFLKGKDVVIEKGKRFTVYVDRDYLINTEILETNVQANKNDSTKNKNTQPQSLADELLKLKKLYDSGILTKEEYELAKKKLLGNK